MAGPTPYDDYRRRAKEAFQEAKFDKALKLYKKAIKKHKRGFDENNLEEVHVSRAVCYLGLNKYTEAAAEADLALALNDQFSKAYYRKAEAMAKLKRFQEAQQLYSKCLTLNIDFETRELVSLRKQVLALEEDDEQTGVFLRYLVPGVDYCKGSSFNPITTVIFEIGAQMRNIVYCIGDRNFGECFVIDPCWDVDGILRALRQDGMRVRGIIHTHNHFDHVGGKPPPPFDGYHISVPGSKKLLEKIGGDAKIYIHQLDADIYQSETEIDPDKIITVTEGQRLEIGAARLQFIHTPGHTPGSQCIMLNERRLFTGDTLFIGSCGRADLPGGDAEDLRSSLLRLSGLPGETVIFPAHLYAPRVMSTIDLERQHGILGKLDRDEWDKAFQTLQRACQDGAD